MHWENTIRTVELNIIKEKNLLNDNLPYYCLANNLVKYKGSLLTDVLD